MKWIGDLDMEKNILLVTIHRGFFLKNCDLKQMTCSNTCTVENKYCSEKDSYLKETWQAATSKEFSCKQRRSFTFRNLNLKKSLNSFAADVPII